MKISYKCKFSLQKENKSFVFRAFLACVGSQWLLHQNNTYAKEAYFGVVYSGTFQNVHQYSHPLKIP